VVLALDSEEMFRGVWKLKIWGYTWQDDETRLLRFILGPYTECIELGPHLIPFLGLSKHNLCETSARLIKNELGRSRTSKGKSSGLTYELLTGSVRHTLNMLYQVSDTFFGLHSKSVPIQMIEVQ
jgi:hypothetical protein